MPRYIDADKINFRLPYFTDESGDALVSLKTVKRCIAMTPTEDVAPKEGEWIYKRVAYADYQPRPHCSCCDYSVPWRSDYCPKCGAKMKGGAGE